MTPWPLLFLDLCNEAFPAKPKSDNFEVPEHFHFASFDEMASFEDTYIGKPTRGGRGSRRLMFDIQM